MSCPDRRHPRLSAGVLLLAIAALLSSVLVTAPAASAATPVPPTPTGLPAGVEELSSYVGANSCDASTKPGSAALGALLVKTYPGTSYGTARACASRLAGDLGALRRPRCRLDGQQPQRDPEGPGQCRRRLDAGQGQGRQPLRDGPPARRHVPDLEQPLVVGLPPPGGVEEYNGCLSSSKAGTGYDTTCHRNHVHISLSWSGAMKRSSYWSKQVAPPKYGPVPHLADQLGHPPVVGQPHPLPGPPRRSPRSSSASTLGKRLVSISGMYLKKGSTGPAVTSVQTAIGTSATGSFSTTTDNALDRLAEAQRGPGHRGHRRRDLARPHPCPRSAAGRRSASTRRSTPTSSASPTVASSSATRWPTRYGRVVDHRVVRRHRRRRAR